MIYNYKSLSEIFSNHYQVTGASLHLRPEGPGEECRSGGEGGHQEGLDHGSSAQLCQEDEHEDHRGLRLLVSNLTSSTVVVVEPVPVRRRARRAAKHQEQRPNPARRSLPHFLCPPGPLILLSMFRQSASLCWIPLRQFFILP